MKNQKKLTEVIRNARALNAQMAKINKELTAAKAEIVKLMGVGGSLVVDDVKASVYESTRTTINREKLEAWLGKAVPASCTKVTTATTVKLG